MGQLITSENKDMMVSWMYTWSRQQEMSIHEQRIILRILEYCQDEVKGMKIKENMGIIDHHKHDVYIQMPASAAIFDSNLDFDTIKKTLEDLMGRYFEYKDKKRWWKCSFICNPEYEYGSGIMKFSVNNKLWDVWLNFSQGYREFELNKALALPTTYSL
ncbi:replication initiation protein, partial [Zoogloea sp. 1C4]